MYLGLSAKGPGSTLELTSRISEETTDFHLRETDRLHICTGEGMQFEFLEFS